MSNSVFQVLIRHQSFHLKWAEIYRIHADGPLDAIKQCGVEVPLVRVGKDEDGVVIEVQELEEPLLSAKNIYWYKEEVTDDE